MIITSNKVPFIYYTIESTSLPLRQRQFFYGSLTNHTILLDDLVCTGVEDSLLNCTRIPAGDIGVTDCTHSEDAGVRCNGKAILLPFLCYHKSIITKLYDNNPSDIYHHCR